MKMFIFDTTLRDGLQGEGMNFSVPDKLLATRLLDDLGVHYIEGGWPGSNPRDKEYFARAKDIRLTSAKLVAFGATRRSGVSCEEDPSIQCLVDAGTPTVAIFGKSWKFQAEKALRISLEENLELVEDTIRYLKANGKEVVFDAEHFFDGYLDDPTYAMAVLDKAAAAGADFLTLCDTNGGTMTNDVFRIVEAVVRQVTIPVGIHAHNDAEMAVANSVAAVRAGATMVQGTINGYGERCGNANLISVLPALELKLGLPCLPEGKMATLTKVSHTFDEIANRTPHKAQPYVGQSAFAHKGGVHINSVIKDSRTYEHLAPERVGNQNRVLISDLSGRSSIWLKASEVGVDLSSDEEATSRVLETLKVLENKGYQFEGADASFKLLLDDARGKRPKYFVLHDLDVQVEMVQEVLNGLPHLKEVSKARVKLEVGGVVAEAKCEGTGPVHAIDNTLRKLIDKFYPSLKEMVLSDYKVRVLTSYEGTASTVRVLIRSSDGKKEWGTVGVSHNVLIASWLALLDAIDYKLIEDKVEPHL